MSLVCYMSCQHASSVSMTRCIDLLALVPLAFYTDKYHHHLSKQPLSSDHCKTLIISFVDC